MRKEKAFILIALAAILVTVPLNSVMAENLVWTSDVSSSGAPVATPVLLAGITYRIRVFGTWIDGYFPSQDPTQSNFADAQYYITPPYDTSGAYYWIWNPPVLQKDSHSFLQIDGHDVDWGSFNNGGWNPVDGWTGHEYQIFYVGQGKAITFTIVDLIDGDYTDNMCHLTIEIYATPQEYPKRFTGSYGFDGFTAPKITSDGLSTTVIGRYSGPRVSWNVTYYFANTEEFLGSQYDGEAHYFRLWDKWGGNLMGLRSTPIDFDVRSNIVELADGNSFEINYEGYAAYIGSGLEFTDSRGGSAVMTLHTGDQQEGTNPGRGAGTTCDGASYDVDLVWNIGYLRPGQSASLTIVVAPGKNSAGKLQFSSCGYKLINTGPRTRVYGDEAFTDFLYSIDRTVQLGVLVIN